MKEEQKTILKGVMCVLGGFLIQLTYGYFYTIGNMAPYLTSYFNYTNHSVDKEAMVWFTTAGLSLEATAMPIGGLLADRFGCRLVIILGNIIQCSSITLSYFTVSKGFLATLATYGLQQGFGFGFAYSVLLATAALWFPKRRGLVVGIIVSGFGAGALVFTPIQTAYINPDNIEVDNVTRRFTDETLLNKIPWLFLVVGAIMASIQFIGVVMIRVKPKTEIPVATPTNTEVAHADDSEVKNLGIRQAVFTSDFYLLWIVVCCAVVPITTVSSYFKMFGQEYISDDQFLAAIATFTSICNAGGRVIWGFISDHLSFKVPLMAMFSIWALMLFLLPELYVTTGATAKVLYAIWIGSCFFFLSGIFVLAPAATGVVFGPRHLAVNYGVIYNVFIIGSILTAVINNSLPITKTFKYQFYLSGGVCIIGMLMTTLLNDRKLPSLCAFLDIPVKLRKRLTNKLLRRRSSQTPLTVQTNNLPLFAPAPNVSNINNTNHPPFTTIGSMDEREEGEVHDGSDNEENPTTGLFKSQLGDNFIRPPPPAFLSNNSIPPPIGFPGGLPFAPVISGPPPRINFSIAPRPPPLINGLLIPPPNLSLPPPLPSSTSSSSVPSLPLVFNAPPPVGTLPAAPTHQLLPPPTVSSSQMTLTTHSSTADTNSALNDGLHQLERMQITMHSKDTNSIKPFLPTTQPGITVDPTISHQRLDAPTASITTFTTTATDAVNKIDTSQSSSPAGFGPPVAPPESIAGTSQEIEEMNRLYKLACQRHQRVKAALTDVATGDSATVATKTTVKNPPLPELSSTLPSSLKADLDKITPSDYATAYSLAYQQTAKALPHSDDQQPDSDQWRRYLDYYLYYYLRLVASRKTASDEPPKMTVEEDPISSIPLPSSTHNNSSPCSIAQSRRPATDESLVSKRSRIDNQQRSPLVSNPTTTASPSSSTQRQSNEPSKLQTTTTNTSKPGQTTTDKGNAASGDLTNSRYVWISNLPQGIRAVDIKERCAPFGRVQTIKIVGSRKTKPSNSVFAYLIMDCSDSAVNLVKGLHGTKFLNNEIKAKRVNALPIP